MRIPRLRQRAVAQAAVLLLAACAGGADEVVDSTAPTSGDELRYRYPDAPAAPDAATPAGEETEAAIDRLLAGFGTGTFDAAAVEAIGSSGDARHAWFLSDLLRFFGGDDGAAVLDAFESTTGVPLDGDPDLALSPWLAATNHLIAWDTPSYPGYAGDKTMLLLQVEPRWEALLSEADLDWRVLNWGGVLIDDRPLGDDEPCARGCIPALDDPAVTGADGGDWYPDDGVVFGIVVGDDALAVPKHIAEVHEMFNLTLGGQRLGIPYCTLCGSAQAFRTAGVEGADGGELVLRTSGLLSRSNKVMFDLGTMSVFDTFTGAAVSGPLHDAGVVLDEVTVVRSTWGGWKAEHPDTSIIAEDGGIGRAYPEDPLRGRDDDGPIFPVGAVDDRLPEHELVVGVITADGIPVAFGSDAATAALDRGETPSTAGVELMASGDGLRGRGDGNGRGARRARGVLVRLEPVPPGHRALGPLTGLLVPRPRGRSGAGR